MRVRRSALKLGLLTLPEPGCDGRQRRRAWPISSARTLLLADGRHLPAQSRAGYGPVYELLTMAGGAAPGMLPIKGLQERPRRHE